MILLQVIYWVQLNLFSEMFNSSDSGRFNLFFSSLIILVVFILLFSGCADEPSSLGLNFLPPGDTAGIRIFDSSVDTMLITSTNIKQYVNTSQSGNLLIGMSSNYDSKALVKFSNLSSDYDSSTILSATLTLTYQNYYFPNTTSDSLGQISFDIFTVSENLNYYTITLDSVTSNSFGTISQGGYSGTPTGDSEKVNINLNTNLVKDWLEYAADTNYQVKNYGIALIPNNSSSTVKGFYSVMNSSSDLRPQLTIILTKNNDTDTLNYSGSQNLSLVNTSFQSNPEIFRLQSGVSYSQVLKFDLSKIPQGAIINDVQLFLTLDTANSEFTSQTIYKIRAQYISDTSGWVTETFPYFESAQGSTTQYVIRVIAPFQRWFSGQTNFGILLRPYNNFSNLDLFSFFDVTATDITLRPRVIIKYTPRIIP